ncbi:SDR family NAD(P)-dependent oxidoreductase [Streptomyces sp. NRRL F-525]|uniref:SDR family NAD(P)-dependent oxidoreductase n=1 Tax=Streptomyces sp. NRRL F-525 TaxID=1463861 RepID=UPI0005259E61|nr:SDR family NAD(P)-dependent oxidoreductase [Streptomyces sp. NRRL F-525]
MSSVLITGAPQGIGRAIAVALAGRGHRVIATARRPETLADLPVDRRLRLDVTDQESVDRAVREAGDIDVLVSNTGEAGRAPLESVPLAEVERLCQVNTLGALRVAQAVLPAMRERGAGCLVFVSSIQGRMVLPMIGPYGARVYLRENDPYTPLYQSLPALRGELVTPEDVAAVVADTIEHPAPPLRVPAGAPAERALRARKEAPEDEPFLLAGIDW